MTIASAGLAAPLYGGRSLADVLPSVLASLGVADERAPLALPPVRRACVLLIDGLGWAQLTAHRALAPFLSSLADGAAPITVGFPTTTATSLTSVGTGLPPGGHGIFGYQVAIPGGDHILNQLRWYSDIDPEEWQPHATVYERAERAGVATAYIASGAFDGSGLSRASARGSRYVPAEGVDEVAAAVAGRLAAHDRALLFAYHPGLDSCGHQSGIDSDDWRAELARVDRLAERIAGALPPGSALYVTGDHGMVDVPPGTRIDVGSEPALTEGVRVLAGEARARHVYARAGAAPDVLAAWSERLGTAAEVLSRDAAVDAGLFGPVDDHLRARIGDVLALARDATALVAPCTDPAESTMVGMHGSLTAAELYVPLLRATTGA
ncbi:alkaline phosphatase family protein [Nocardiopsis mangrovi]|uniref:Alkaline phosphatase family protein n=1 Tax=Nocardiopsis mangrovi TaxID=1179818 RepID=A0ABV9DR40_9ACTN